MQDRRVKPMAKQNTVSKPMATPPPSPTVNGISVFDISTNTEVSTDGSVLLSPDPVCDTEGSTGASTDVK